MNDEAFKYIGKALPLHDSRAKATGSIRYTGDMSFQGMLHAKLLFSPLPHAKIRKVDTSAALDLPGVYGVYCHQNTPKTKYNGQVWFQGQATYENEELFSDTVRFVGDRVAAVVAENKEIAEKAVKLIEVDYEKLPAYFEPEEVADNKSVRIHEMEEPFFVKTLECGDLEKGFQEAALVVEDRVETPKIHHAAMENHVCIAVPDHNGKITVYSPCQILYSVRLVVAKVLGLPFNKVRVIKSPMGGSFGGKQEVILEPLCAFLARETGKPVKIEFDRRESIIATRTRTKTIGYVKTAVDKDGKILARDVETVIDTGAYTSNGAVLNVAMGKKIFRLYRIENQCYSAATVHTNTPVAGATRGYGSPQIHALTEINIDNIARKLKLDPLDFRLQNLVHPSDSDPTGAPSLGNARIRDCVLKGAQEFGWRERRHRIQTEGRFKRGVGMACATHINGYYGAYQDFTGMTLKMLEDGSMILNAGLHELGQGVITSIKQIIAEVWDMPPEKIEIPEGDSETTPYDIGCQASRVIHVCGAGAIKTAQKLKELFKKEAAKILQCMPEEVMLGEEKVWNKNHPVEKISCGEMAALIQRQNQLELIVTESYVSPANPASYGVNFVEVEVDTLTGLVRVLEVLAVHDVGKAINPGFVRGQIYGGIQMGL